MLTKMVEVYRRQVRGEGIEDELPKGLAADLMAIWLVLTLVALPACLIWS
jgi:hypothetical protein